MELCMLPSFAHEKPNKNKDKSKKLLRCTIKRSQPLHCSGSPQSICNHLGVFPLLTMVLLFEFCTWVTWNSEKLNNLFIFTLLLLLQYGRITVITNCLTLKLCYFTTDIINLNNCHQLCEIFSPLPGKN